MSGAATVDEVDGLTGLPRRPGFFAAVRRLGPRRAPVWVLLLDLDDFHVVNRIHGHDRADELLRAVARRLVAEAGRSAVVGRVGGDQFAVALPRLPDAAAATRAAEKLARAVSRAGSDSITPTVCVGLARMWHQSVEQALEEAVLACRQAKSAGPGSVRTFDERELEDLLRRFVLQQGLSSAAQQAELRLLYQPEVDLEHGTVVAAEALLRWEHPELGSLTPAAFIDVAETSGVVVPLGRWVIDHVAAQAAAWRSAVDGRPLQVWMNLSPAQLSRPVELVATVRAALAEHGLGPSSLGIEITESAIIDDAVAARETLTALADLGVDLAVDDFGTGYASFAYLRDLPVSTVKIDRTFVGGLATNRADAAIVEAVIDLAHALGRTVVAEGVETSEQAALLRRLGADRAQGYLYSPPTTAEALLAAAELSRPTRPAGTPPSPPGAVEGVAPRRTALLVGAIEGLALAALLLDERVPDCPVVYVSEALRAHRSAPALGLPGVRALAPWPDARSVTLRDETGRSTLRLVVVDGDVPPTGVELRPG